MVEKREIRKRILKQRKAMDQETVTLLSGEICRRAIALSRREGARNIAVYMPINNEVDTGALIELAEAEGKRIWLPRITDGEMDFFHYDKETPLEEGPYHILEPASREILVPDADTLIFMPGAVFSIARDRIGYGGGYYDRYLRRHPACGTAALCYDFQIVEEVPAEPHDIRPQRIISERRILGE
ncbi:5-formyltetrahydrofolate cyclo-ligase [bacterium 210820-DFI.6.37]|nr:5-formyltetrahydrofolate cyclo-ligase [bacterium 210820-DFI.6.37]